MKRKIRVFSICMAGIFLFAGCGKQADTGESEALQSTEESQEIYSMFEDDLGKEVGSVEFSMVDPLETVYTYDGNPIEIPFYLSGVTEESASEVGVMLFVDGILQPYEAVFSDGSKKENATMQTFTLKEGEKAEFDMSFSPITGKSGDTLSVMAVTVLNPGFLPESEDNPNYGCYHDISATIERHIQFQTDAKTQALECSNYETKELAKEITDELEAFGGLDSLDTSAFLSIVTEGKNLIYGDGKQAEVKLRLYGIPNANFHVTLFVNHQIVKINGSDFLTVRTEKNKMAEITIPVDTASLGEKNTVYAIAALATEDEELETNNPIKTESVLLVNKEEK